MAKKIEKDTSKNKIHKMAPAITPEAREDQLIYLATELAEKQLREGTASSQVITHYLKLGTTKERLEKTLLEKQTSLVDAKISALKTAEHTEELYANAIAAMRDYGGNNDSKDSESNEK